MAFDTLMARMNMLLNGVQHESEDSYTLLGELQLELNQLKATGQPLPDDLAELEQKLEQELANRLPAAPGEMELVRGDILIDRQASVAGGRYIARVGGIEGEAELTYTQRSATLVSADHTDAPEAMRGTGAAKALVAQLVTDAREEGFTIVARCSYIAARRERHPEWADVMQP